MFLNEVLCFFVIYYVLNRLCACVVIVSVMGLGLILELGQKQLVKIFGSIIREDRRIRQPGCIYAPYWCIEMSLLQTVLSRSLKIVLYETHSHIFGNCYNKMCYGVHTGSHSVK